MFFTRSVIVGLEITALALSSSSACVKASDWPWLLVGLEMSSCGSYSSTALAAYMGILEAE